MLNKFKKNMKDIIKAFWVRPIEGITERKRLKRHKKELDKLLEDDFIILSEED